MDATFFVDALKTTCRDKAISDCVANFRSPPGRKPSASSLGLSVWFNALSDDDQAMVVNAMREAADSTLFGVLCVLDGVRVIESEEVKSTFGLVATKDRTQSVILPSDIDLHDLL